MNTSTRIYHPYFQDRQNSLGDFSRKNTRRNPDRLVISKSRTLSFCKFVGALFIIILISSVLVTGILCYNLGKDQISFLPYSETYEYTVRGGDTLWSIADEISDGYDLRRVIYEIKQINNLKGDKIYPWDKLILPKMNERSGGNDYKSTMGF